MLPNPLDCGCELIMWVPSTEAGSSRKQFILMTTEPPEPSLQFLRVSYESESN